MDTTSFPARRSSAWPKWGLCALLVTVGCHTVPPAADRATVSAKLVERTGHGVGARACGDEIVLPNGACLEDGLTEEEAILIALWNNALFQEQLADLGVARGDLIQAGLLPNPEVFYLFHVPDKPFRYAFEVPLEAFFLRPIRVRAAADESARVAERLTQLGLDLIRDVRQGYADVVLARGRLKVAEEGVQIRGQIAKFAEARLKAGDISPQEATTARIDGHQAQLDLVRITYDVSIAEERLRFLMGIGVERGLLLLSPEPPVSLPHLDVDALTEEAIASRPDALAAEQNVAAAAERLRLSKLNWVRFLGIGDATSGTRTGHEFGPAFRATVPIFNWNQGNIAKAQAELERAERQRQTVRDQIILDVRQSHHRYYQARSELEALNLKVRPEVEGAIRKTELAYREGNTPYNVVLETSRQLLDSRFRQQQLLADLRRMWADLERSVGRRIDTLPSVPESKGSTP